MSVVRGLDEVKKELLACRDDYIIVAERNGIDRSTAMKCFNFLASRVGRHGDIFPNG